MIGIMSDSHDNLTAIRAAVDLFNEYGAELVLHAGDLISPFTAQEFDKLESKFEAIYGNNDGERIGLAKSYSNLCSLQDFKELKFRDLNIAMIHGTNESLVRSLAECNRYHLVIRGHTHQCSIKGNKTLVINPGETCGYLSGKKSVLTLKTNDLSYEIHYL